MPLARFVVNPGAPSAQPVSVDAAFEGLPRSGTLDQAGNYWVTLSATGRARCLRVASKRRVCLRRCTGTEARR